MAIPRDEEEARKFVEDATSPWRERLLTGPKGAIKPCLANAITAFRSAPEWAGMLHYDAFAQRTVLRGQVPWMEIEQNRVWLPRDDFLATDWLQHQGIMVNVDVANQAIETVAEDQTYHPVIEYLQGLSWDGIARLDSWTINCLGVAIDPETERYVRAVSAAFLIGGVARVMQPGCKADCALILEGPQGIKKSTALKTLFQPWFTDELPDVGTKDAAIQLAGVWGVEMAELDSMRRSEVSKIKAFLSRSIDVFRPPYGKRSITQTRQCVFAGTVNDSEYLRDETGGRRFWPLICGIIDIERLKSIRDQLWAEARERFFAGEPWWLDDLTIIATAAVEQSARRVVDGWQDEIEKLLLLHSSITASELLIEIGIPIKEQTQIEQNRAVACIKALGWFRKSMRKDGKPAYRYVPPV